MYDSRTFCNCAAHDEGLVKLSASSEYSKILDNLIDDIFNGALVPGIIHDGYYNYTANQLLKGIQEGLKGSSFAFDDYRNGLLEHFQQNIYAFSGAKSLTAINLYNKFLTDDTGNIISREAFRNKVLEVDPIFSINHLFTERQDAIATAQMADLWQTLKNYPALQYSTAGDKRVRPEHAVYDKMIIATNDPLLDKIIPVKDHGCRCTMLPAPSNAIPTDREAVSRIANGLNTKPYFKGNPGKTKVIYADDHPYYQNGNGKVTDLQAERNYGMRSVKQIYDLNDLPVISYMPNKDAADTWWLQKAGSVRGSFDVKAPTGINVRFDNNYRNHVLNDNPDDRHRFLHKSAEVVTNPDEVWSVKNKGILETRYIKYYDDFPVVVKSNDKGAFTMFQCEKAGTINVDSLKQQRRGQLLYKNENR